MPLFSAKSDKLDHQASSSEYISPQRSNCSVLPRHFFPLALDDYGSVTAAYKKSTLAVLLGVLMLLVSATSFELWQYNPAVARENGLLEMTQDFFLLVAFVTALLRYKLIRSSASPDSHIFLALTLFSLAFFLREVDIDKIGSSSLWPLAEKVLRALAAVSLLGFVISVLRKTKMFLSNFASIIAAPVVILAIIAGAIYIFSWPFDKKMFAIDKSLSQLCEEVIELNACLLLAFATFSRGVRMIPKPL